MSSTLTFSRFVSDLQPSCSPFSFYIKYKLKHDQFTSILLEVFITSVTIWVGTSYMIIIVYREYMFITVYRDLFIRFLIVSCLSLPVCLWLLELLVCLGLLECLGLLLLLLCLGLLKCLGVFESLGLPPRCGSCGLPLCGCGWCSRDLVLFTEISGSCRTENFWSPRCGLRGLPRCGCGWCSRDLVPFTEIFSGRRNLRIPCGLVTTEPSRFK